MFLSIFLCTGEGELFECAQQSLRGILLMAAVLVELEASLLGEDGGFSDFLGPCIGACFVPLVLGEPEIANVLVAFHPHHITLSSPEKRVAVFRTSNRIVAFNTVLPAGMHTHWLLVLTEVSELYVLALKRVSEKALDLVVVQHFKLSDSLMQKKLAIDDRTRKKIVVSQKCFIKVDETGRFIFVHSSRRFVVVLELKPSKRELFWLASVNKAPQPVRKNPELASIGKYKVLGTPDVYSINDDMVVGIEALHSRDANDEPVWWLAVLMRNKKLEYDLSYYKLSTRRGGSLELHTRFPAGETHPNLIIPVGKFLILLFDTYHAVCFLPEVGIIVESDQQEGVVEFDEANSCLKQDLFLDNGRNKFFRSYTLIDEKSILLVTASSEYYRIELDYEYIPFDTSSLRTRSRDSPENNTLQNTLIWKKWTVKKAHDLNNRITDSPQVDEIFYNLETDSCVTLNKHGWVSSFTLGDEGPLQTYAEPSLKLPITDLKVVEQTLVSYTCGDLQQTCFKSPHFELSHANEIMKEHIFVESFTVILSESLVQDLSSSSSHDTIERIDVHRADGKRIASYDFEENVTVTSMVPLKNLATYQSDDSDIHREDVTEMERSLKQSFLVLTSSANDFDYENDEDFFQRKRTEIMLMVINEENEELELKTICVLRSRVDCAEQSSRKVFALWGVGCSFNLALQVYKEEEEGKKSTLQLKFIKIKERLDLPINTVSIVRKLKDGFRLLVDPFFGVYLVSIGLDDSITGMHEIFEWNMIISIDVYSEDMFVVGDIMGNIFLLNMDYTQDETPSCELFTYFNSSCGAIGCIVCYPENVGKDKDSMLKLCTVGTSDGAIFSISVFENSDNPRFLKALKAQNKKVLTKNGFNFEQVAKNVAAEKMDIRKTEPLEVYSDSLPLQQDKYIKVSLASDNEVDLAGSIPVVFI